MTKLKNFFGASLNWVCQNKLKSALIAAAILLLIAAIVVVSIVAKNNKEENIDSVPNVAVYYYDVAGGEVLLSLKEGERFTLVEPDGINKSGGYSISGDQLTLDFVRDSDGTATATIGENKLVLILNGVTLTFREKVEFGVTFNSNGGSAVESLKVLNGKTINAPEAPTKENCTFAGWYTDEACTKPFLFGSAMITADTTLYASWSNN